MYINTFRVNFSTVLFFLSFYSRIFEVKYKIQGRYVGESKV